MSDAVRLGLTWGTREMRSLRMTHNCVLAYLWLWAVAKRLLISSQLTVFHQAAR
jgi:hypothetical protein